MKGLEFFKSSKKLFSVRKFVKPVLSQEYYNNLFYTKNKDLNTTSHTIIPMNPPLHPDPTQSNTIFDEKNQHFMYLLHRRVQEMENRANTHIKYAKKTLEVKRKHRNFNKDLSKGEGEEFRDNYRIHKSGLMSGIGYDDFITSTPHGENETKEDSVLLDQLVNKLGYLDMRDFVALNKYILEANNHEEYVNQTKAKFLSLAMKKLSEKKKEEMKMNFRKIDELNPNQSASERSDAKIENMFETIPESKEMFYKYYYQIKEVNEREERKTLNQFEKYDKMMSSLQNPKVKKIDKDETVAKGVFNKMKYDLEDYMERIIKNYRDERTKDIKSDTASIMKNVRAIYLEKNPDAIIEFDAVARNVELLAKFQTLIPKYKKVYTPTNMETERLINKYLREKRLKDFTKEKMMQEEDPYYSPLTDEEDFTASNNVHDEESKKRAMERHNLKKAYFDAKYEYERKKLEENIDKQLADELGIVIARDAKEEKFNEILTMSEMSLTKKPDFEIFLQEFLDDHYKSFKLNYMYNYMDYFSNKYKVRRKIAEEMKGRVSIREISHILDNLVAEGKGSKDLKSGRKRHGLEGFMKAEYGVINPDFIETLTETSSRDPNYDDEVRSSVISAIQQEDKKSLELTEAEVFEMELYKGIKNDPYYKHYLHTHFAHFSETMNDIISLAPQIIKGYKPTDVMKYEILRNVAEKKSSYFNVDTTKAISENKNDVLNSLSSNMNALSPEVKKDEPKTNEKIVYRGSGKRKKARAYAEISQGSGRMTINGKEIYHYFPHPPMRGKILYPLSLTNTICTLDVKIAVQGGGHNGQSDAIIPAISKALIKLNPSWRALLAKHYCLKHDPRNVEPKKPGRIKARKGYVYNRR